MNLKIKVKRGIKVNKPQKEGMFRMKIGVYVNKQLKLE